MFSTNVGWEGYLLVAIVFVGLYYYILRRLGFLKQKTSALTSADITSASTSLIPIINQVSHNYDGMTLPVTSEEVAQFSSGEPIDLEIFEFLEDDNENILLKEAERVVDKIQLTINETTPPPVPEDVISRIKDIVSPYRVFIDTEYYGAINTYIALSLERDLGLTLPSNVIESLWN